MAAAIGPEDEAGGAIRAMLADLDGHGITVWRLDAPHAAAEELQLLAWLAAAQREAVPDKSIPPSALACGAALHAAGHHLPYRALLRVPPDAGARRPRSPTPHVRPRKPEERARSGSLRTRAIMLARRERELSVQDFLRIGISRQYLSRLCAYGDLVRVGFARYRIVDR